MRTEELVKEYLSSEGYRYDIDGDGDIHFKYEGIDLFFTVDKNDQSFFRLIMPSIYTLEGNRTKVLEAINTVTRDPRCMGLLKAGREKIAAEIFG